MNLVTQEGGFNCLVEKVLKFLLEDFFTIDIAFFS